MVEIMRELFELVIVFFKKMKIPNNYAYPPTIPDH